MVDGAVTPSIQFVVLRFHQSTKQQSTATHLDDSSANLLDEALDQLQFLEEVVLETPNLCDSAELAEKLLRVHHKIRRRTCKDAVELASAVKKDGVVPGERPIVSPIWLYQLSGWGLGDWW